MENDKWETNYKNVTIKMTDGSVIRGKVNVVTHKRLSDLLKHTDDNFVTIVATEETGECSTTIFIVNKTYIVWVESEN
jgi:hypothetical protein